MIEGKPFRVLPRVTPETEHFWRGGEDGELRFLRCTADGYLIHPPGPVCPRCLGRDLEVTAVSGDATVTTYTVNHKEWYPGLTPPYVVAIVTIAEQDDVRLMTNLVNVDPGDVEIGMAVRVAFEQYADDVWLPFFQPA